MERNLKTCLEYLIQCQGGQELTTRSSDNELGLESDKLIIAIWVACAQKWDILKCW